MRKRILLLVFCFLLSFPVHGNEFYGGEAEDWDGEEVVLRTGEESEEDWDDITVMEEELLPEDTAAIAEPLEEESVGADFFSESWNDGFTAGDELSFADDEENPGHSGTCGENLTWVLDEGGTLTISGSGEMENYDGDNKVFAPWYSYRDDIKEIIIEDEVTSIGDWAFLLLTEVSSLKQSSSLTSIGNFAFYRCTSLERIDIPETVKTIGMGAFFHCHYLEEIHIPPSVTKIERGLLQACYSLKTVQISSAVTEIGVNPFAECDSLKEIVVEEGNPYYCSVDGVLFDKEMKTIISYPGGKGEEQYSIPSATAQIGPFAFYRCDLLISVVIPESVTEIERHAFDGCYGLFDIIIPASATNIAEYAFANCGEMLNAEVYSEDARIRECAFAGCRKLSAVLLAGNIKEIGEGAFRDCSDDFALFAPAGSLVQEYALLNSIPFKEDREYAADAYVLDSGTCGEHLSWILDKKYCLIISGTGEMDDYDAYMDEGMPEYGSGHPWGDWFDDVKSAVIEEGVESIGDYAFFGLERLGSITIASTVTRIGQKAFYSCGLKAVTIPDGVTAIEEGTFEECYRLLQVSIPNSVTNIGERAFYFCSHLEKADIPPSVTSIGNSAFSCCSELERIDIPSSVTSIGEQAFFSCDAIERVFLSSYVTSLGSGAFSGSNHLQEIVVSDENPYFTSIDGVLFSKDLKTILTFPASRGPSYTIPTRVEYIGESSFQSCENLETIVLPSTVKAIGIRAFCQCGLKTIDLQSVEIIEEEAFYDCWKLTELLIPHTVRRIGTAAFADCSNLTSVTIPESVEEIGDYAFYSVFEEDGDYDGYPLENLTIYGYAGSYAEDYADSNLIPFVRLKWPLAAPGKPKAENSSKGVKLSWKAVPRAKTYAVYRTSYGMTETIGTTEKTSFVDQDAVPGDFASYAIQCLGYEAEDELCDSSERSAPRKWIYLQQTGGISVISKKSKTATVYWNQGFRSTYQLRYASNSSMKSAKTVKVTAASEFPEKRIKGLKKKTKYWFQVREYYSYEGKKYYGAWSRKQSLKIK